jgi:hypothetical protein
VGVVPDLGDDGGGIGAYGEMEMNRIDFMEVTEVACVTGV